VTTSSSRRHASAEIDGVERRLRGSGSHPRKAPMVTAVGCRDLGALAATADYDVLVDLVGFWIRRAQVKVLRSFARHLENYELSPTEVAALILMSANDGLSQIALASALDADQSTVVNMLLALEQRNMISRIRHPKDRRYQVLSLTADGSKTVERVKTALKRHNQSLQEKLSPAERKTLLALLKRFVETQVP
jgi:DNA-binding MarR family transcriptional regulator